MKKIESIRKIADNKSIILNTSPPNRNKLFMNKRPAQNIINGMKGCRPKISIKNVNEAIRSIPPNIWINI